MKKVADRRKMRFASKIACKSEICCNFGVKSDENGAQFGAKWGKMMRFDKIPPIRALKCEPNDET
mgnify:CR=1 FL=1